MAKTKKKEAAADWPSDIYVRMVDPGEDQYYLVFDTLEQAMADFEDDDPAEVAVYGLSSNMTYVKTTSVEEVDE